MVSCGSDGKANMNTFTELVDEILRSTSRRRRNNKSRGETRQGANRTQAKGSESQSQASGQPGQNEDARNS